MNIFFIPAENGAYFVHLFRCYEWPSNTYSTYKHKLCSMFIVLIVLFLFVTSFPTAASSVFCIPSLLQVPPQVKPESIT